LTENFAFRWSFDTKSSSFVIVQEIFFLPALANFFRERSIRETRSEFSEERTLMHPRSHRKKFQRACASVPQGTSTQADYVEKKLYQHEEVKSRSLWVRSMTSSAIMHRIAQHRIMSSRTRGKFFSSYATLA
jgi:hypothetical protein